MKDNNPSPIPGIVQGALIGIGTVSIQFLLQYFQTGAGAAWIYAPIAVVAIMGIAKSVEVYAPRLTSTDPNVPVSRSATPVIVDENTNTRSPARRILFG